MKAYLPRSLSHIYESLFCHGDLSDECETLSIFSQLKVLLLVFNKTLSHSCLQVVSIGQWLLRSSCAVNFCQYNRFYYIFLGEFGAGEAESVIYGEKCFHL